MAKHEFDKEDFALFLDMMLTVTSNNQAALLMLLKEKNPEDFEKKQIAFENLSNHIREKLVDKIFEEHGDLPDEIKSILKPPSPEE